MGFATHFQAFPLISELLASSQSCHSVDTDAWYKRALKFTFISMFASNLVNMSMSESERESDIASRWVHRQSNLMFTLNSGKKSKEKSFSLSVTLYLIFFWEDTCLIRLKKSVDGKRGRFLYHFSSII